MEKKSSRTVRVGLVQLGGTIGDVEQNVKRAVQRIVEAAAQGAEIICLPELFATGYNLSMLEDKTVELGEHYYDVIVDSMSRVAAEHKVHLIAPIGRKTRCPGILANSALIFDDKGALVGHFDKTHLWALEALYYKAGNSYPVFDLVIGGKTVRIGIMICYDAGFPEACRSLALAGAEIVFCPSAWRIQDVDMWDINMPQRALENLLFIVAVNRVGHEGDLHLFGKGKVCNPRGHVLMELPMDEERVDICEIDLAEILRWRTEIPYLRDRKPTLYSLLTERL